MPNPTFLALEPFDGTVVMVSIVLVFAMLVALCLIIMLEGRFFDRASGKAAEPAPAAAPAPKAAPAAPAPAAPAPAAPAPAAKAPAAPVPADGAVPGEVVAAIAAAVSVLLGEGAVVRGIRRVPASAASRRGAWGDAAARELTTPFM